MLAQLHNTLPAPVHVPGPALFRMPNEPPTPSDLSLSLVMPSAMLVCRLNIAAMVPPLQLTVPMPANVFVPLTEPEAISKVLPPPMELVPLLNVMEAPLTRLVPPPSSAKLPLKKNAPWVKSITEPAAAVKELFTEIPPPPSARLPL